MVWWIKEQGRVLVSGLMIGSAMSAVLALVITVPLVLGWL